MRIFLYILSCFNLIFSMSGLELAQKMKDIPKPIDNQSNSSMLLTNKKGKEKNLKLISNWSLNEKKYNNNLSNNVIIDISILWNNYAIVISKI